jgi:predicted nucleotidyltransferase
MISTEERVVEHYNESLQYFPENKIIGIFLQGSQNYGLETKESDVDTKLIVAPSFKEFAFNLQPMSTTHVRKNNEHIDFKDVRLMFKTLKKQNLNFLEILFTDYCVVNPIYYPQWSQLIEHREEIAHYNPYAAVRCMQGHAKEKYKKMGRCLQDREEVFNKYGYDPKQFQHLVRIYEYLSKYISGNDFIDCLHPDNPAELKMIKQGKYNLNEANALANEYIEHIDLLANDFYEKTNNKGNPEIEELLNNVQYDIIKRATREEI